MIQMFKVRALPNNPLPGAFYFVLPLDVNPDNDDYAEAYLTDKQGVPKQIGNSGMIQEVIDKYLDTNKIIEDVININARDALPQIEGNRLVYVLDATADPAIESGGAFYIWDGFEQEYTLIASTSGSMPTVIDGGNF